jgi:hypothetical protein
MRTFVKVALCAYDLQVGCAEFMLMITLLCAQESGQQLQAVHAFSSSIHAVFVGEGLFLAMSLSLEITASFISRGFVVMLYSSDKTIGNKASHCILCKFKGPAAADADPCRTMQCLTGRSLYEPCCLNSIWLPRFSNC